MLAGYDRHGKPIRRGPYLKNRPTHHPAVAVVVFKPVPPEGLAAVQCAREIELQDRQQEFPFYARGPGIPRSLSALAGHVSATSRCQLNRY